MSSRSTRDFSIGQCFAALPSIVASGDDRSIDAASSSDKDSPPPRPAIALRGCTLNPWAMVDGAWGGKVVCVSGVATMTRSARSAATAGAVRKGGAQNGREVPLQSGQRPVHVAIVDKLGDRVSHKTGRSCSPHSLGRPLAPYG